MRVFGRVSSRKRSRQHARPTCGRRMASRLTTRSTSEHLRKLLNQSVIQLAFLMLHLKMADQLSVKHVKDVQHGQLDASEDSSNGFRRNAMSDGCREENRMTCSGCPKFMSCERNSESVKALLKLKEHYPKKYRNMVKPKRKRKSAARLKVKR